MRIVVQHKGMVKNIGLIPQKMTRTLTSKLLVIRTLTFAMVNDDRRA